MFVSMLIDRQTYFEEENATFHTIYYPIFKNFNSVWNPLFRTFCNLMRNLLVFRNVITLVQEPI